MTQIEEQTVRRSARNLLLTLCVIALIILFLAIFAAIGVGITWKRVEQTWIQNNQMQKIIEINTKKIRDNQEEIKTAQKKAAAALEISNQQWITFQQHNPTVPVPLVQPDNKEITVLPPLKKATPAPSTKHVTKIYIHPKHSPTPKPWYRRFDSTR